MGGEEGTRVTEEERLIELEGDVKAIKRELDKQRRLAALKDLLLPQFIIVADFDGPGRLGEDFHQRSRPTCLVCKERVGVTDEVYAVRFRRFNHLGKGSADSEEIGHLHVDCFGASTGCR